MSQTEKDLNWLMSQPEAKRDENWEVEFLSQVALAKVELNSDATPIEGPDGWPYLSVKIVPNGEGEPFDKVVHWAAQKGVGLVVNPHKNIPDYVFTYGMMWSFREWGEFRKNEIRELTEDHFEFSEGQEVFVAPVTTSFVPAYVSEILIEFFKQQEIENPRWMLLSMDEKQYDLVFSLESMGGVPDEEQESVLEALSWFFPTHYVLSFLSEGVLKGFHPVSGSEEEPALLH